LIYFEEPGDQCPTPSDIDLTTALFCGIQDLFCGFLSPLNQTSSPREFLFQDLQRFQVATARSNGERSREQSFG
jgi:hypothetical protein